MPVKPASRDSIAEAAAILRSGGLVAFPTETVYGLGADATKGEAVARIFEAKGRPRFNPLITHVSSPDAAFRLGQATELARRLAATFWPGPLTLVVPRQPDCPISELATAGLDTIALRVPAHPVARDLLLACALPLAAPSANRSGHVSPTEAAHVAADLGDRVPLILDGGPCRHGLESSVVLVNQSGPPVLLRPGAITREVIEAVAGCRLAAAGADADAPVSPGRLASHYAPTTPLRLEARSVDADEALLAFGTPLPHAGPMCNLSASGDLIEAAANLFSALRELDRSGARAIAVMPVPRTGLGEAINDRLRRAAH